MKKSIIKLGLSKFSHSELLVFAQTLRLKLTSNLNYPSPVNPTLAVFSALITDFRDALKKWDVSGGRGSELDYFRMLGARDMLERGINGISHYCQNQTPYDGDGLLSAGFALKKSRSLTGQLPSVQNLHQFIHRNINFHEAKIRWTRPLETPHYLVHSYHVYRNTVAVFETAELVATVTKVTYTDRGLVLPNYYYWVVPIGVTGPGVISDPCLVAVMLQP